MVKHPEKSAKEIWDAQVDSQRKQHEQRSITLNGETIQKKVIFETVPSLQRADQTVGMEVCEHISFGAGLKTPAARELVQEVGYHKGSAYGDELRKIVEASLVAKEGRYVFDPAAILEQLTPVERQMMASGKTNVQEFMERNAESSASRARNDRKLKETQDALSRKPEPPPRTIDRSVGKQATPELRKAYEENGIKPERVQRRLDDAWDGKPAKPFFYDKTQPEANPDAKKSDSGDQLKKTGPRPPLKPV